MRSFRKLRGRLNGWLFTYEDQSVTTGRKMININIRKYSKCRQECVTVIAICAVMLILVWNQPRPAVQYNPLQVNKTVKQQPISPTCNCSNRATILANQQSMSFNPDAFQWCSSHSYARGTQQKVIAYTIYGNVDERYYSLLTNISLTADKLYPGWIVRIYHNFHNQSEEAHRQLCNVYCQFHHVDLCSVPELIQRIRNVTKNNQPEPIDPALLDGLNPRMLRYLVMFDPNVDIFISRDADSMIWQREVDAVGQWLQSNYTFHVMRDHPNHIVTILAGMWGAKMYQRRDLIEGMMRAAIRAGQNQIKNTDQVLLNDIVWPTAQYDVMVHDSFHCQDWAFMAKTWPLRVYPFPTQRDCGYFIGGVAQQKLSGKCPEACRPPDHKDWEYC